MRKIIFHIDVNSAFLSWEAVYRLRHRGESQDLRETASAVGGDIAARHGIIQNRGNHSGSKKEMSGSNVGSAELRVI